MPLTSAMMTMDREKSAQRRCMGVFAAGRAMQHVSTMAVARPRVGASIGLKTGDNVSSQRSHAGSHAPKCKSSTSPCLEPQEEALGGVVRARVWIQTWRDTPKC